jgi:hypothetical protein
MSRRSGAGKRDGSRLAASRAGSTTSPAGIVTPPTSMGAAATAGIATCTGPS